MNKTSKCFLLLCFFLFVFVCFVFVFFCRFAAIVAQFCEALPLLHAPIAIMASFDDLVLLIGQLAQEEATLTTQLVSVRARATAAKAALAKVE